MGEDHYCTTYNLQSPVNGKVVAFEAYNVNGNNCFKLRDFEQAVNNIEKNFKVTWDGVTNTVGIDTSKSYIEQ